MFHCFLDNKFSSFSLFVSLKSPKDVNESSTHNIANQNDNF